LLVHMELWVVLTPNSFLRFFYGSF
jgi:hypothetical protein